MAVDDGDGRDTDRELARLRRELQDLRAYKSLVDALPFGVMVWDTTPGDAAALRLVYGNAEASRQSGADLARHMGKCVAEIFPEQLRAPEAYNGPTTWLRVADNAQPELMPAVAFGADATTRTWINAHAIPLGAQLVASIYEDVTTRVRAEHEIRELNRALERTLGDRERRYHSIFASASVGLCETDLSRIQTWLLSLPQDGMSAAELLRERPELAAEVASAWPVREVNDAALRLLGQSREQVPDSLGRLLLAASPTAWLELLVALADGAATFETELQLQTPAGMRDVLLTMRIPEEAADYLHVVVSLLDVTERKRLERALWTVQRMEAVGSLTGGVAHDFNNLLMVICSYAGFLRDQFQEGHQALDDVKVIEEAAGRAALLTSQLLAFSRRQVQQLETLDGNEVVREISAVLRSALGKEINFAFIPARQLGLIRGDRAQVEQVLMNLTLNARDAMPNGGTFTIATENVSVAAREATLPAELVPPGPYVRLTITDTGNGMDEATRSRVFEPFFSTKERGHGTGLGLATVYGVVKQNAGYIGVRSEPGRGTTFEVYLPCIDSGA